MRSTTSLRRRAASLLAVLALFATLCSPVAEQFGVSLAPTAYAAGPLDGIEFDGQSGSVSFSGETGNANMNTVLSKGKVVINALLVVALFIMLGVLILQFMKLGAAADNDIARRKATSGILTALIATALLATVNIWYAFAYGWLSGVGSAAAGG